MKRYMLIGCGFLGGYFCRRILGPESKEEIKLVVVDKLKKSAFAKSPITTSLKDSINLEYRWNSAGDPWKLLEDFAQGIDAVIYTAAIADVPYAIKNPIDTLITNVINPAQFMEFLKAINYQGRVIMMSCYDDKTKVITTKGILSYDEIQVGDNVFTVNPNTNKIEIQPVERVIVDYYEGEMIRFYGRGVDIMVTPNHRMFHYGSTKNTNRVIIEDARQTETRMERGGATLLNPIFDGIDSDTIDLTPLLQGLDELSHNAARIPHVVQTDAFMYLLGIYIADGYVAKSKIIRPSKTGLTQKQFVTIAHDTKGRFYSIPHNGTGPTTTVSKCISVVLDIPESDKSRQRVESCLKELGMKYYTPKGHICIASQELGYILDKLGKVHDKHIPEWAMKFGPRHLEYLFMGLIDGDGHVQPNITTSRKLHECISLTTVSEKLTRDLYELTYKIGMTATVRESYERGFVRGDDSRRFRTFRVVFSKRQKSLRHSERLKHKGNVWCLTVRNGNFLTVRNGKTAFCGNSESSYGHQEVPSGVAWAGINEDTATIPKPSNIYGVSKFAQEGIAYVAGKAGLKVTVLRSGTMYGAGSRPDQAIPIFVGQALSGVDMTLEGGDQTRDFNHVENVVDAITAVIDAPEQDVVGEVFNIGSGTEMRFDELAKSIKYALKSTSNISIKPYRSGEKGLRIKLDISKAQKKLKYEPRIHLFPDGLADVAEWVAFYDLMWSKEECAKLRGLIGRDPQMAAQLMREQMVKEEKVQEDQNFLIQQAIKNKAAQQQFPPKPTEETTEGEENPSFPPKAE